MLSRWSTVGVATVSTATTVTAVTAGAVAATTGTVAAFGSQRRAPDSGCISNPSRYIRRAAL
jgi:hypothetical protein